MAKIAPVLILSLNLLCIGTQAAPPFYYGKGVKVISKDSIYYGCYGTVTAWADSEVVVGELCGDYKSANFKAEELKLNRGSAQRDSKF